MSTIASSGPRSSIPHRAGRRLAPALTVVAALALATACVPPDTPAPALSMDPTTSTGFFSMPWPNDIRRQSDGTLDLDGLPGVDPLPGESVGFLRDRLPGIVEEIGRSVDGFGVNTATYFTSNTNLDLTTLPTPSASLRPDSPVMLLDLDHPGERAPVIVDWQRPADRNRAKRTLTVLPYPGHPLRESTRYAVAVLDGVRVQGGAALTPAPLIARLDAPWTAATGVTSDDWDALREQRDAVRTVLAATTDWNAQDLVAFTVFTTQDVDGDTAAVAAAVDAAPPPTVDVLTQQECRPDVNLGDALSSRLLGTVELTRWQQGEYPYHEAGGEIEVDGDGRAVPQGTFDAIFTASVPCGDAPAGGWPLLTFIDGTGGGHDIGGTTLPLTHSGWLLAQIAPVYGQGRDVTITPLMQQLGITTAQAASQFTFYNFLNPDAARTNTIQQAGENLELIDAISQLAFDGASLGTTGTVGVDASRVAISGQSQGAQTLPMVAAVRPSISGVVSSAGSGGLFHTISHNTGNRQFLGQLTGDAAVLDELNPIVQVSQTMLEGGDGLNYRSDTHYLNYDGIDDLCVPFDNSRYFAGSIGLPISYRSGPVASIYGDPTLDPVVASPLPVQGNVEGRTRLSIELPGGHFVAYDQKPVTAAFLSDLASGQTPTVPAEGFTQGFYSSLNCPGPRWDVPPTRFGR